MVKNRFLLLLTLLHSPRKYSAKPSAFVAVRKKKKTKKNREKKKLKQIFSINIL